MMEFSFLKINLPPFLFHDSNTREPPLTPQKKLKINNLCSLFIWHHAKLEKCEVKLCGASYTSHTTPQVE